MYTRLRSGWVALLLVLAPAGAARAQADVDLRVPMERYSLSPFLPSSFLFLQGTELPDQYRFDLSLGFKYMHQPWRVYESANSDYMQAPVEDHFQFRPALSFGLRRWFDVAAVVPFSYQTAGETDRFTGLTEQEGLHLLDPEIFLRVPLLHQRRAGFGVALGAQVFLPLGSGDAFVDDPSFRAGLTVAADWAWGDLLLALNTGVLLREERTVLNTPVGSEWFLRPGAAYYLPLGDWAIGLALEANIASSLTAFFSERNGNAFQLLLSVVVGPRELSGGLYANLGGGSHTQGGGYGVPLSHVDARLGYSIQWLPGPPEAAEVDASDRPATAAAIPPPTPPAGGAVVAPTESPEDTVEVETAPAGAGGGPRRPRQAGGTLLVDRSLPLDEALSRAERQGGRADVLRADFAPDAPAVGSGRSTSGSAAMPDSVRQMLQSRREQILDAVRRPGARLLIVGFTDKCYNGPPDQAALYNRRLAQRRAEAMLALVRETFGSGLEGVELDTLAMGWTCANSKCRCATPEIQACAADRKVELIVDFSGRNEYTCPAGEYWLAQ